jgi:hypothetical protein
MTPATVSIDSGAPPITPVLYCAPALKAARLVYRALGVVNAKSQSNDLSNKCATTSNIFKYFITPPQGGCTRTPIVAEASQGVGTGGLSIRYKCGVAGR